MTEPTPQIHTAMMDYTDNVLTLRNVTTFDIPTLTLPNISKCHITIQLQNCQPNVAIFLAQWCRNRKITSNLTYQLIEPAATLRSDESILNWHIGYKAGQIIKQAFLLQANFNRAQWHLLFKHLISNINTMGIKAVPVFAIASFFLGVVIMFQSAYQMSQFAAELYAVDFLAISVFRELGPILTGILLSSRTASAITAQIGSMRNNDELAAMETMNLSPVKLIMLPKLLALLILGPILTFFSCVMAMLGGLVIFTLYLQYSIQLFLNITYFALTNQSFWMFAWKGPVFSLIVGIVACAQGISVRESSVDLSQKTTNAVVMSLLIILLLEGFLSFVTTV